MIPTVGVVKCNCDRKCPVRTFNSKLSTLSIVRFFLKNDKMLVWRYLVASNNSMEDKQCRQEHLGSEANVRTLGIGAGTKQHRTLALVTEWTLVVCFNGQFGHAHTKPHLSTTDASYSHRAAEFIAAIR